MFRKLRNHLLLVNMVILTLVMLAAFISIYAITYSNAIQENDSKLDSMRALTLEQSNEQSEGDMEGNPENGMVESHVIGYGSLPMDYSTSFMISVDENGNILNIFSHLDLPESAYNEAVKVWGQGDNGLIALEGRQWQYRISTNTSTRMVQSGTRSQTFEETHHQIAFLDITDTNHRLVSLLLTFVIVGILMLAILFAVSMWVSNRSIRPIEENWNKQKQFVTDASHELKTPLAIIDANLDALRSNGAYTVDSQIKWIDYMGMETHRMAALVNDMLYLAKAEMAEPELLPVDLSAITEDAVASMEAIAYEKSVVLTKILASGVIVKGEADRMKQVVLILLENAVKYTEPKGNVNVSLVRARHQAVLTVKNSGAGISAEELPKIFDRFYRGDPSRSSEAGGYGLGLSIAKAIVERMGGKILAESGGGLTAFTVILKQQT